MKEPLKVLILTVPLGNGHNAAAKAIEERFTAEGTECVTLDLYEYISPTLKEFVSKFHVFYMKSFTKIKGVASDLYDANEKRDLTIEYSPSQITSKILASRLKQFISEFSPDIIICTQVYAAQAIDILKEKGEIGAVTVGIITDFTVQVYWENTQNLDYIITASERLKFQLKNRGIEEGRALAFGIPISSKFTEKKSMFQAKKELNISKSLPAILIMGGGMGFGNVEDYIEEIDAYDLDLQTLIVCGNNNKLLERISSTQTKKKKSVYGFVNNIDVMMDACECVISKPGGITVAECLSKELPIIAIDQLPGIEDRNLEFLLNNGAALYATNSYPLSEALDLLLNSEDRSKSIKRAMRSIAKPNASGDLYQFLAEKVIEKR